MRDSNDGPSAVIVCVCVVCCVLCVVCCVCVCVCVCVWMLLIDESVGRVINLQQCLLDEDEDRRKVFSGSWWPRRCSSWFYAPLAWLGCCVPAVAVSLCCQLRIEDVRLCSNISVIPRADWSTALNSSPELRRWLYCENHLSPSDQYIYIYIYIYIQVHLNKLECREKSSFFLVTYFKKWNFHIF